MNSNTELGCISSLWQEYGKTKDLQTRNKLVEAYLWLVVLVAKGIKKNIPYSVELEDLVAEGVFGLIEAIERFDPFCGVKFRTYCTARIRGAILDKLRKIDWVARIARSRVKQYQSVKNARGNGNGHAPTLQEIVECLDVSLKEAERIETAGNAPTVRFLTIINATASEYGKDYRQYYILNDTLPDKKAVKPGDELSKNNDFDKLLSRLIRIERRVVTLYYQEGFNMRQIGEVLGLSVSRISRLHARALKKIKTWLLRNEAPHDTLNLKWVKKK